MKRVLRWLLACALLLAGFGAQAYTGCRIEAAPPLAFGAYRPLPLGAESASPAVLSTATLKVGCNAILAPLTCLVPLLHTHYTVTLGAGGSGNAASRRMSGSNGGPGLNYQLHSDAARLLPWGDGVNGAGLNGLIVGCGIASHVIYGRVPGNQRTVRPGGFSDSVVVTVSFSPL
jgi:spore coat protein U-like protein